MTPEAEARLDIDRQLAAAGWVVQSRHELNLHSGPGIAVREFQSKVGPCDYLLFLDGEAVGVLEAKRVGTILSTVEAQTIEYAKRVAPYIKARVKPLPFLYESTGKETQFTNLLDPTPRSRRVFTFHRPETLREWITAETDRLAGKPGAPVAATFLGRMQHAPPYAEPGVWDVQLRAVNNLERSVKEGRRRALVQMSTGSGKTLMAVRETYRLIRHGGCRRVLFLVDRGNLGKQALTAFQNYDTPDDGRKFTSLYNAAYLRSNNIDPVNRVVITTIQRLYSILKGDPELPEDADEVSAASWDGPTPPDREAPPVVYNQYIPPEFFDVVFVDECHRSIYTLWRQVLEYFDATLIGLTATPAKHTYGFFNRNLVMEYRHDEAVRDRVNVPFEVYQIKTRITTEGSTIEVPDGVEETGVDIVIGRRDRGTRDVRWERLDETLTYSETQLDRSVVAEDQIRTVVREIRDKLYTEIMPGRYDLPKMLFFAKTDTHAEDVLRVVREEFNLSNEQAVKITYMPERGLGDSGKLSPSKRADHLIQAFRNSYNPRIAVTVDMISTGTDIRPLEVLVFMRTVKSRTLFEQMVGRGVRVIPETDFRAVTRDAQTKTHFVVIDAVGVFDENKIDTLPLDTKRTVSFERLMEVVAAGSRDEAVLSSLAARLDRIDRKLTPEQQRAIQAASGGASLRDIVAGILDRLDPDAEVERARAMAGLPPDAPPTAEQVDAARAAMREEAVAPLAYNPTLRAAIADAKRAQDQILDVISDDEVLVSRFAEHGKEWAKNLVGSFETFVKEHKDEITALQVLYSRPYRERLRFQDIRALADAIRQPPRSWTADALWAAYETLEKDRVRGRAPKRLLTDLVSLVRFALDQDPELVPFAERVEQRFENWLAQQQNSGRTFTAEQLAWLRMMKDTIAGQVELRVDDLDGVPFVMEGGLGRAVELFGAEGVEVVLDELNRELVA